MWHSNSKLPPQLVITGADQFIVCDFGSKLDDWLRPEVVQRSDGFVVYDPVGRLLRTYRRFFECNEFCVKSIDTANLSDSARYNPFAYVRCIRDVLTLTTAFINGTEGIGRLGDMRFLKAERLLFSALTSCVAFDAPKYERNIGTIISMLEHMLPNEDEHRYYNSSNHRHSVDFLLERIEGQNPDSISAEMYQDFKYIAGTHAGMIVESWLQRLTPFRTEEMCNYFSNDELGLDHLGTGHSKRVALFISAGKSDYFDFLVPLLYSQLFDRLYANWTWR